MEFLKEIRNKPIDIDDMQERAYDILDRFSMRKVTHGGVRIVSILNEFGIKTYLDDIKSDSLSAYILIDPALWPKFGTDRIACINTSRSDGHKRFAIAHELAHFLFDYNGSPVYMDTYISDLPEPMEMKEQRANRFAACILMPEDVFREKYNEISASRLNPDIIEWLSGYFRVSTKAVKKRFGELGINYGN